MTKATFPSSSAVTVTIIATAWLVLTAAILAAPEVPETAAAAATCNPMELSVCLPAINGSAPPTAQCCAGLKEQAPCFCNYINNPMFKPYLDSPNIKKVVEACGVAAPTC